MGDLLHADLFHAPPAVQEDEESMSLTMLIARIRTDVTFVCQERLRKREQTAVPTVSLVFISQLLAQDHVIPARVERGQTCRAACLSPFAFAALQVFTRQQRDLRPSQRATNVHQEKLCRQRVQTNRLRASGVIQVCIL